MTTLLYLEDSYLKECDAVVQYIDDEGIVLDKTIFYAAGGGQPTDRGVIEKDGRQYPMMGAIKKGDAVMHIVEGDHHLEVGDCVRLVLDWKRRYKLMRSHTAAHLLSVVIHKETGALITGNQKQEDKTRVDFNLDRVDNIQAQHFVDTANEWVAKALPVKTYSLPRDEAFKIPSLFRLKNILPQHLSEIRIVEIEGVDTQACGGTHLHNITEIKNIQFLDLKNKGKENRRIYFSLSDG